MVGLQDSLIVGGVESDPAPVLVVLWLTLMSALLFAVHVSFRLGRPVSRWHHPGHMRGIYVQWGYCALPLAVASGSILLMLIVGWIFKPSPPVLPWPYLPFLLVALAFGLWAYKEFERPTLSRTPSWLHERMKRDLELREMVYGKRPFHK